MMTSPFSAVGARRRDATAARNVSTDEIVGDWVIGLSPAGTAAADLAPIRVLTSLGATGEVVAFLSPGSVLADDTRIYPRDGHGWWRVDASGQITCRYGAYTYDDRGSHIGELHVRVWATLDENGELQGTYERRDLNARGELYRFRCGAVRGFRAREILRNRPTEVEAPRAT